MDDYRLPAQTQVGGVHLQVPSLERALSFYRDMLGFREVRRGSRAVGERPTARPHFVDRITWGTAQTGAHHRALSRGHPLPHTPGPGTRL